MPAHTSDAKHTLRSIAVGLLVGITSLTFASYMVVRWAETNVLSAENWVSYASKLPQNSDVSWAIADKLIHQVFPSESVERRIQEVLPPRAGFLASPLSDELRERSVRVTQRVVEGDAFQSLWTGANRLAIERFLSNARAEETPQSPARSQRFDVDISGVRSLLHDRLENQVELSPALQEKSQQAIAIRADLQARRERVWRLVRTTDTLYKVLPPVIVAGFLGVLVFAVSRRKAVMTLAGVTLTLLLLALALIRYIRGQVIDEVQNPQYVSAISFVYDSLVADLRATIMYGLGFWLIVIVVCLFVGPSAWAVGLREFLRLPALSKSQPASWWRTTRGYITRYRYSIWLGISGITLSYLAFFADVNGVVFLNSLSLAVSGVFMVQLLADSRS